MTDQKTGMGALLFFIFVFVLFIFSPVVKAGSLDQKEMLYGSPASFAEFHGFLNLEYYDFDNQLGSSNPSNLSLQEFFLSAKSNLRENMTIFGEIEIEQGVFKLDRAFIDLKFNPLMNFQFGKFFTPFGINKVEATQSPFNKLVSVPLPLAELGYSDWADVGAQMYGIDVLNPVDVGYHLALLKGPAGFTEADLRNNDNNRNETIVGRGIIGKKLKDGLDFEIGASVLYGKYDDRGNNLIRLWGADAKVQWMGLDIRGEYMNRGGNDATLADSCNGTNTPGTCTVARAEASGYYIQTSYLLLKNLPGVYTLEPVIRLDKSDLADHFPPSQPDTAIQRLTAGLNYAPYAHFHIKGEYQFTKNDGTDLHNDGMMLSVLADF